MNEINEVYYSWFKLNDIEEEILSNQFQIIEQFHAGLG
jgi:hypothetical protein